MNCPGKQPAAKLNADFCAGRLAKLPLHRSQRGISHSWGRGLGKVCRWDSLTRWPCAQPARERQNHSRGGVLLAQPPDKIIVVRGAVWLVMANVTPLRGVQSLYASRFPEKYLFREKAQSLPCLYSPAHRLLWRSRVGAKINEGS